MNTEKLADAIRTAGLRPFASTWRSNKNDEAADMMGARSHFYDESSMRFFGCRVAWCDDRMDGIIMVAVMSQKVGFDSSAGREWRFAIHDFTGHHLAGDSGYSSRALAEKALAAAVATLDPAAIVRDALTRELRTVDRAAKNLRAGIRKLPRAPGRVARGASRGAGGNRGR